MINHYFLLFVIILCFYQTISTKSCNGYCNTNILVENICMCNDECMHNNNCCMDFFMVCTSNENITNSYNITINDVNNTTNYLRKNDQFEYNQFEYKINDNIVKYVVYLNLIICIILFNIYMYFRHF